MEKKYSLFEKIVNFTAPLSLLLQTYGWGKFDFTFILISILIVWGIVKGENLISRIPILLKIYLFYYLFVYIISLSSSSLSELIPLGWLKMFFSCGLYFSIINLKLLKRYYNFIAVGFIGFFFVQILGEFIYGIKIPGVFNFLPITLNVEDISMYLDHLSSDIARASSFFSEPAHFAFFLIPLLILHLFEKNKKLLNWIMIGVIVLTLLILRSGNGLIGLIVTLLCFSIWNFFKKRAISILVILFALIFITPYYVKTEIGEYVVSRQDQLQNDSDVRSGLSGFIRIYRGYYVYDTLSTFRKIVGANNSTLIRKAINASPVSYLFFSEDDSYFNVTQTVLIRTGIIGAIILLLYYLSLFNKGGAEGKTFILNLFVLGFVAALYFSETMILFLVLAGKFQNSNHRIIKLSLLN